MAVSDYRYRGVWPNRCIQHRNAVGIHILCQGVSKWLMQFGNVSNPSSLGTSVVKSCFSYLSTVIMIKSCDKEKMEFHTSLERCQKYSVNACKIQNGQQGALK